MSDRNKPTSVNTDVNQFLAKVAKTPALRDGEEAGRLLFAMDATASRESTWDRACHLQAEMFHATTGIGNLSVQLCYYRGFNNFHTSNWCRSAESLLGEMSAVRCLGGHTQINKVLEHAQKEHKKNRLSAIVFVGDAVEESADDLCHLAGQLGVLAIPVFMFQEGADPSVRSTFKQIANLSGGAYAPFNLGSADELKALLSAVAVFATGGRQALDRLGQSRTPAALLSQQMKK
jgi:hypothetical protein